MKKLIFLCFIFISTNVHSLDENQLISLEDLNILFDQNKNKWNENVLFLIKKKSFTKINNNSDIYFLKSIYEDGEIITMPIFSNNFVKKIEFEYNFLNYNDEYFDILKKHFNSILEFCTDISIKNESIFIEVSKCN
tara:strand:- start:946 stop:1353 length:408 start_codon:yes stop_codon:yes gene_type:complete